MVLNYRMNISTMDVTACQVFFNQTFSALEVFRLMYPTEWRQNLTGDILNKYITCVECQPKIMSFTNETLLRKLCLHVNDVLVWAQAIENEINAPEEPSVNLVSEEEVMSISYDTPTN